MFGCMSVGEFGGGEFRGVELGAEEVDREFGCCSSEGFG